MSRHSITHFPDTHAGRRTFLRLSGTALLAAASLLTLAGCGGSGGGGGSDQGGGGGGSSPYAGSYQGVYLNTSGPFSPDAGTFAITVSASGSVTGTSHDFTGDGSNTNLSGTVSSTGALATNGFTGPITQNTATHVFTTSFTETNNTHGVLNFGLVPTNTPLAGSYAGTFSSTGGGSGTTSLTISAGGTVTGTTLQAGVPGTASGYVDSSANAYLAYTTGGVRSTSVGSFTLNGTALTGTLHESGADGASNTVTVNLTKQ